jgi:hypothetical protein
MRKEAAFLLTMGVLVFAGSAQAAPTVLAQWPLDEGSGQVAADTSGQGHDGVLGATAGSDLADPIWIAGHDGGSGLDFGGSEYISVPDSATLEPGHVAVEAWVRRLGSPGRWRYVVSKGSLSCERSAYGLYSGWTGGLAFYVSSATNYVISPEVSAKTVWDGRWHHVIGSYDGDGVRLWIDGSEVGTGTPTNMAIAYGVGSKDLYVGIYRGSCDLGFDGAIDDARIWDDEPPTTTGAPVIPAVPGTPTVVPVANAPSSDGAGTASGTKATACLRLSLSRHTVPVKRRALVLATVRRSKRGVAGVRVVLRGEGVNVGARTNRRGTAKIVVRAHKRGRLTVRVTGQKAGCPVPTVRAR